MLFRHLSHCNAAVLSAKDVTVSNNVQVRVRYVCVPVCTAGSVRTATVWDLAT